MNVLIFGLVILQDLEEAITFSKVESRTVKYIGPSGR